MARKQLDERIRVGDFVKVKVPKFVVRVGYPKGLDDYLEELEGNPHFQQAVSLMLEITTGDDQVWHNQGGKKHRARYRIEREIAYLMAKRDGFGGRERSIHWVEYPEHEGTECTVEAMRTVYTGHYFPPGGGYRGMFEENDYEPGGLSEMNCHRIARLTIYPPHAPLILRDNDHRTLEIPVYHLEKLRSAAQIEAKRAAARKAR